MGRGRPGVGLWLNIFIVEDNKWGLELFLNWGGAGWSGLG